MLNFLLLFFCRLENVDVAAAEIERKEETVLLLPETPMHTYGDQG